MFIERLDPRQLMAVYDVPVVAPSGLDAAFAGNGQFTFRKHFLANGPIARGDGAIFVSGELINHKTFNRPYVVKVRDNGTVDPAFGDNGYAALPFRDSGLADNPYRYDDSHSFAFTGLTYDAAHDAVYVAAVRRDSYYDGTTLGVTRLTATGAVDTAFGSRRGTFSYAPPKPAGRLSTASARVAAVNPLADGSVVLAVDRQTHAATDRTNTAGDQSLALLKLRPDGTPDPTYGTGGVTQLLGGTVGARYYDGSGGYFNRDIRRGFFNDVRTNANGITRVVLRYETGYTLAGYDTGDENQEIALGRFDIKARTVSAAGVVDDSKSYAWELFNSKHGPYGASRVSVAVPDGNDVRVLVRGEPGYGSTAALHTLRPDGSSAVRRLRPEGIPRAFSIARSPDGDWFAFNDGRIARLNSDFTPDRAFAVNGVASTGDYTLLNIPFGGINDINNDPNATNSYVLADERGRFVVLGRNKLARFA